MTQAQPYTLGAKMSRDLVFSMRWQTELLKRAQERYFQQHSERMAASARGWAYSRYPEDSPRYKRRERIDRIGAAFAAFFRVLKYGDENE